MEATRWSVTGDCLEPLAREVAELANKIRQGSTGPGADPYDLETLYRDRRIEAAAEFLKTLFSVEYGREFAERTKRVLEQFKTAEFWAFKALENHPFGKEGAGNRQNELKETYRREVGMAFQTVGFEPEREELLDRSELLAMFDALERYDKLVSSLIALRDYLLVVAGLVRSKMQPTASPTEPEPPEPKVARLAIDGIEPAAKAEDFKPFSEETGWKVGHQPTDNLVTLCDDIIHLSLKPLQSAILAHLSEPDSPLSEVRVKMLKFIIERFCHQSHDFLEVDTEEMRMEISASYPLSEKIQWGGVEFDCYLSALDSLCRELRERLKAGTFRGLLGDYISHSEDEFEFLATKIKRELASVYYSKPPVWEEGSFAEGGSSDEIQGDEANSEEATRADWLEKLGRTNQKRLKALLDSGRESFKFSELARLGFIDRDKAQYQPIRNAADAIKKELSRLNIDGFEISVSKDDCKLIFERLDCGK